MITLITGVPGSGKSLHAVSDLLLPMQGAEIEHEGQKVKRVLHTNIKNLLLDHVHIDKDDLLSWPTWCKPGDLICFDEVQEVWRPRSMGSQTPDSIAKLETHRHMGVDFVIITQHPMLLDQNIRRLVGRHLHVRRVANMALAVVYEWDHASNPSMVKSAITTRPWRYPKSAYKLYKSAEAHTKQPRRLPFALVVVAVAALGLSYGVYAMQGRLSERYSNSLAVPTTQTSKTSLPSTQASAVQAPVLEPAHKSDSYPVPERPLGCIATIKKCACYDQSGYIVPIPETTCRKASTEMMYIVREKAPMPEMGKGLSASLPDRQSSGEAKAEGSALSMPNVQNGLVDNVASQQSKPAYSQKL